HEVGHHVYAPGDVSDHARLYVRLRRGLPGHEPSVPMIANLYTYLLINDRLQRTANLDMVAVFRRLRETTEKVSPVWAIYMRTYECLWGVIGELVDPDHVPSEMAADASVLARLIRVYSRAWLDGATRFAMVM